MRQATEELKAEALRLGFNSVGVCDAIASEHFEVYERWISRGYHGTMRYLQDQLETRRDPRSLLASAKSVVGVTLDYYQAPLASEPKIARYALGRDYHKVMRAKLRKLAAWISATYPDAECRACVDSAPILEREFASLAGLGWFGKNTMLIDSKRGSWFFVGLLLTSVEFRADEPAIGGCGTCMACVESCPTGAIAEVDGRWQVDSRSCLSYLTIEHRGSIDADLHGWTFGCDVCQEVCPFNAIRTSQPLRARMATEPDFLRQRAWPQLEALAEIDYDQWDALTRGSAVRRAGFEGIRRNARLNLTAHDRHR